MARWQNIAAILLGVGLLTFLLLTTPLAAAWEQAQAIKWGFGLILALYMAEFLANLLAWMLAFEEIPLTPLWAWRLWKMKMLGEAVNIATPFAHMGGEPLKAFILKRRHQISYHQGIASIILATSVIVISLVLFLSAGFALMLNTHYLSGEYKWLAGIGLGLFVLAILLFYALQRGRLISRFGARFEGSAFGHLLADIRLTEDRLVAFYTRRRMHFLAATLAALLNWLLGVVTLYVTFHLLGAPITLTEAWIAESFTQLVRATTFFIPANLGSQDGAFVLITTAITGNPALGLAVAMVRRGREIVWVIWGALIGLGYIRAIRAFRAQPPETEEDPLIGV